MKVSTIFKSTLLLAFGSVLAGGVVYLAMEQGPVTGTPSTTVAKQVTTYKSETSQAKQTASPAQRFKADAPEAELLPAQNPGAFLPETSEARDANADTKQTPLPKPQQTPPPLADLQPH